jgi:hypothetical protein
LILRADQHESGDTRYRNEEGSRSIRHASVL